MMMFRPEPREARSVVAIVTAKSPWLRLAARGFVQKGFCNCLCHVAERPLPY